MGAQLFSEYHQYLIHKAMKILVPGQSIEAAFQDFVGLGNLQGMIANLLCGALGGGDIGGDAAKRVRYARTITEQEFHPHIVTLPLRGGPRLLDLNRFPLFNHLQIADAHFFREIRRVNVEVGLATDLLALDIILAFILAINQEVMIMEILDENDGGGVVDNILQSFFAGGQGGFGLPAVVVLLLEFSIQPDVIQSNALMRNQELEDQN